MKNALYIIMTLLFLQACQANQSKDHKGIYTINAEKAIDTVSENISLDKIAKNIKIIQLETTPASLIKNVNSITLYKDYILILNGAKCSMFNIDGKFISDIGQKGNGPQEYLSIDNIFVQNDTIYLYDSYKNVIHKFTPDNKYISKIKIDSTLSDFRGISMIDKNDFIVFTPDKGKLKKEQALTFFNTTGVIKDSILRNSKLSQPVNINWYFSECSFVKYDGKQRYKELFSDTVYTIENKADKYIITPKYIFNLGKYKAIGNVREKVQQSFFAPKMYAPFSEMAKIELLGENSKYLFFMANNQRQYFYNKEEDKLNKWALTIPEYEQACIDDPAFFAPLQIDSFGNLLGVMKSKNESDNPSIIIVEF